MADPSDEKHSTLCAPGIQTRDRSHLKIHLSDRGWEKTDYFSLRKKKNIFRISLEHLDTHTQKNTRRIMTMPII